MSKETFLNVVLQICMYTRWVMYTYVHVWVYVCTYMHMHIPTHPRTRIPSTYTYTRYIQTCMQAYDTCTNANLDTSIRIWVEGPVTICMHTSMHTHLPKYIHTHITCTMCIAHACMHTAMSKHPILHLHHPTIRAWRWRCSWTGLPAQRHQKRRRPAGTV